MAKDPETCPKCDGRMEQGFILDNTYGAQLVAHWVPGAPLKAFFLGTRAPSKKRVPIATFRCESCGYLESYARLKFAAR